MYRYRDVTGDVVASAVEVFPEVATALEAVGFERVGLVVMDTDVEGAAVHYQEPDASWYRRMAGRPATVLRAPGGVAFAEASAWFGDELSLRFRSELADGSLCETLRALSRHPAHVDPRLTVSHGSIADHQRIMHAPWRGVSCVLVTSDDPVAVWEAHRAHLAAFSRARSSMVTDHRAVAGYVAVQERAFSHRLRIARRTTETTFAIMGWLGSVGIAAAVGAWLGGTTLKLGLPAVVAVFLFAAFGLGPLSHLLAKLLHRLLPVARVPPTGARKVVLALGTTALGAVALVPHAVLVGTGFATGGAGVTPVAALVVVLVLVAGTVGIAFAVREGRDEIRAVLDVEPGLDALGPAGRVVSTAMKAGDLAPFRVGIELRSGPDRDTWIATLAAFAPREQLDAWVASAPDDPIALLVRGSARAEWASRTRGGGAEVDAERAAAARDLAAAAIADLEASAAADPASPAPHAARILPLLVRGADAGEVATAFDEAVRRRPDDYLAHAAMLTALTVRWGGSVPEMFAFARKAAAGAGPGSALHALLPLAHVERRVELGEAYLGEEAARKEVATAFDALATGAPDRAPLHQVAAWNAFAAVLAWQGDNRRAGAAFERIGDRVSEHPWACAGHAGTAFLRARQRAAG